MTMSVVNPCLPGLEEVLVGREWGQGQQLGQLAWEGLAGPRIWHLPLRRQQAWPGRSMGFWKCASAHSLLSYQQIAEEARKQGTDPLTRDEMLFWSSMKNV